MKLPKIHRYSVTASLDLAELAGAGVLWLTAYEHSPTMANIAGGVYIVGKFGNGIMDARPSQRVRNVKSQESQVKGAEE